MTPINEYEDPKLYMLGEQDKKIAELQAKLAIAKETLGFYADPDNWSASNEQTCPAILDGDDIQSRTENSNLFSGGRLAGSALHRIAKLEGKAE